MNKWKVTYENDPDSKYYVYCDHISQLLNIISIQNWNRDNAYITKLELVGNDIPTPVRDSKAAEDLFGPRK